MGGLGGWVRCWHVGRRGALMWELWECGGEARLRAGGNEWGAVRGGLSEGVVVLRSQGWVGCERCGCWCGGVLSGVGRGVKRVGVERLGSGVDGGGGGWDSGEGGNAGDGLREEAGGAGGGGRGRGRGGGVRGGQGGGGIVASGGVVGEGCGERWRLSACGVVEWARGAVCGLVEGASLGGGSGRGVGMGDMGSLGAGEGEGGWVAGGVASEVAGKLFKGFVDHGLEAIRLVTHGLEECEFKALDGMVVKEIEDGLLEEMKVSHFGKEVMILEWILRFHTCLTDILGFLEKFGWWFEQDIDGESEDDNEKKLVMMNEEGWMIK
ncbi:hypothetical protein Tco_0213014 [Tanacetum coccineum]